ncbi:uncharacterized protein AMSG_00190 [Thecamonas trahens ATCC 50062]|uniref:Transmembrane protein n=1 Tax=Thecamonas trahens ATCC 50062 TaxID=461836 RepID=A0A0L0D1G6_THETB|nr:hypothetical protein AMSG_00190 [Thecamonas trahens ATCC 50062]KNC46072.1 hypothetical protein AMSG_00190 [Thecamonas trahens ATCC 50062]|eukprot:XP_013763052.1 hypothetical protein AMSG_00190 [Thecamonas trahens ATCC 50062]
MSAEGLSSFVAALRRPTKGRYTEDSLRNTIMIIALLEVAVVITLLSNHVKCTPPNTAKHNVTLAELPEIDFVQLKCASQFKQLYYTLATTLLFIVYALFVYSRSSSYLSDLTAAIRKRIKHDEYQIALANTPQTPMAGSVYGSVRGPPYGGSLRARTSSQAGRPLSGTFAARSATMPARPGAAAAPQPALATDRPLSPQATPRSRSASDASDPYATLIDDTPWAPLETPHEIALSMENDIQDVIDRFRRFKVVAIIVYAVIFVMAALQITVFSVQGELNSFSCHSARFSGLNSEFPNLVYTCASVVTNWIAFMAGLAALAQLGMFFLLFTTYRTLKRYGRNREWEALVPSFQDEMPASGSATTAAAGLSPSSGTPFPLLSIAGQASGMYPATGVAEPSSTDAASMLYGAVSGLLGGNKPNAPAGNPYSALPEGLGLGGLPSHLAVLQDAVASLSTVAADMRSLGDPALLASLGALSQHRLVLAGLAATFRESFVTGLEHMAETMRARASATSSEFSDDEAVFLRVLDAKLAAFAAGNDADVDAAIHRGGSHITGVAAGDAAARPS